MRVFLLIIFLSLALTGCSQCTKITDYKEKKRDYYLYKVIGTIIEKPNHSIKEIEKFVWGTWDKSGISSYMAWRVFHKHSLKELKFIHTYMDKNMAQHLSSILKASPITKETEHQGEPTYMKLFYARLRELCLIHSVVEKYEFCRWYQPSLYPLTIPLEF